jgi:hypothetical protein
VCEYSGFESVEDIYIGDS